MPNGPKLTAADLIRDGNLDGSSSHQLFFSFVAEIIENSAPKLIGYTISFNSYSTWQGKTYFLEDIYIRPEYRKHGFGKALFVENVKFALEQNCCRFDFHVLNWNPAKKFYEALGAQNLSANEGWEFFRLYEKEMDNLVTKSSWTRHDRPFIVRPNMIEHFSSPGNTFTLSLSHSLDKLIFTTT